MSESTIKIYTDGSCHTQLLTGAWAAIIFNADEKEILKGWEEDTTHNRMELQGVIKALEYLIERKETKNVSVYSDSQYVVNLLSREQKLKSKNFLTNKGTPIQNVVLVKRLLELIEQTSPTFVKVKAHQKNGDLINKEVDLIVRALVRARVKEYGRSNG